MLMAEFNCPHCGSSLEAPASMDGETHACPYCNRPVTLQVITTKDAVKAGIVAGGLAALAAMIFGGDN
jgi:transcription elongation factor Elf1